MIRAILVAIFVSVGVAFGITALSVTIDTGWSTVNNGAISGLVAGVVLVFLWPIIKRKFGPVTIRPTGGMSFTMEGYGVKKNVVDSGYSFKELSKLERNRGK